MNKQIEMKEMIRYGWKDRDNGMISEMRWNKLLDMMKRQGNLMNKQIEKKKIIR
jgi:hypothetical protein